MKTIIYLVRHTETVGNIENRLTGRMDFEITSRGYQYIKRLTEHLKSIKFKNVYASTSGRTIKTVEQLAKFNNCEVITSEELCEMDFGDYDGWTWNEVEKINPNVIKSRDEEWIIKYIPHQEDLDEVVKRMDIYIRKIAKENEGNIILIGSHGVAIEGFLRNITGDYFSTKKLGYSQKNTAINILFFENDKFFIVEKASIEHLK